MGSISKGCVLPDGPIHLLIDSTGLKVFGAGEWLQEKSRAGFVRVHDTGNLQRL
jgi:hypothetical protein